MPEQKIGLKSAKRFGTRYGATNKLKLALIEEEQRKLHPCPQCGKPKAKWQSVGIWECKKCGHKFTAKAYSITKSLTFKEKATAELTPAEIEAAHKAADDARKEELAEE
ncbi:MAG TPA: 50S ribosomal protein L37ae [Candidatus Binatia bacterium]|nr:50S ribosomal protein L37ae [Candidatus Binatia bacterium]